MSLPLWIRRLPHNLSTLRPFVFGESRRYHWGLGFNFYFLAHEGDKDYLFHFDETGLSLFLGPFYLAIGLVDTPEENAWIP